MSTVDFKGYRQGKTGRKKGGKLADREYAPQNKKRSLSYFTWSYGSPNGKNYNDVDSIVNKNN